MLTVEGYDRRARNAKPTPDGEAAQGSSFSCQTPAAGGSTRSLC